MKINKGFGLAEMLVSMMIVLILVFLYMKLVWKNTAGLDPHTKKALAEQGIKTNRPDTIVQHAQDTVDQFNKKTTAEQHEFDPTK